MIQNCIDACVTFAFRLLLDRRVLECTIMPALDRKQPILFVGTHWYTARYKRMYRDLDLHTMDYDPQQARFGADHHITDSLENVARHFARQSLGSIVCNGVFGWGLNSRESVQQAFDSCYELLKPGGWLIVGWNDIPSRKPFDLSEVPALNRFDRVPFPGIDREEIALATYNRHVFSFYRPPQ